MPATRNKSINFSWLEQDLNQVQRQAVKHVNGPVLILAGAGSGKTRVLTYRIAHLIAGKFAQPQEILSMTFTNKAAGEMRERILSLVGEAAASMWIGTFHSLFARILRKEGERLGFTSNFTIYDESDQTALLKTILADFKLSATELTPKSLSQRISSAKNAMMMPQDLWREIQKPVDEWIAKVYGEYQIRLKQLNAMDFDDLLLKPIELFQQYPLVLRHYQERFRFILVDEYQDTNRAQYLVLRMLADKHKNICVVGDDDQSIYRWRGAELRNILEFEADYPDCAKFRLEQNYRSTQNILSAAHSVIRNNRKRHEKELWTRQAAGEPVCLAALNDERAESRFVVDMISKEFRKAERHFYDFAVLYRTNAQSRVLEEGLRYEGIPYIIIGGLKFYERKEVKDVLAYLRVLVNPQDSISLRRIINYPIRGIGETTLTKIEAYAQEHGISLFNALPSSVHLHGVSRSAAEKMLGFHEMMQKYIYLKEKLTPAELAATIVDEIGIIKQFKQEATQDSLSRAENVQELLTAVAEFAVQSGPETRLETFLQHVSLTTDIDNWDDKANAVTLMTLHAAKGLEFAVVFIVGLEEGLFPLSRSMSDPQDLEEERRLFYVGTTRAKDKLYLTYAQNRKRYGGLPSTVKSRFLKELDLRYAELYDHRPASIRGTTRDLELSEYHDMPRYEDESQESLEFRVGMRVYHTTFEKGTIMKIESYGGKLKLIVLFDSAGERKLVLPHAKLEIL